MADISRRSGREERSAKNFDGFTLVELLVVIAIIGVLAGLLLPVIRSAKAQSEKAVCKNNLRQIAISAGQYAADYRGVYPWPRAVSGAQTDLSEDADARACIELLYRYGYIDDPKLFLCESAKTDEPAEHLETEQERRTQFHLEENQCSYTWRKKLTTTNNDTRTPLSGDKRHGEDGITNHTDGRHVAFLQGNVEFFNIEKLEQENNSGTKRARRELIGFDRIGRSN